MSDFELLSPMWCKIALCHVKYQAAWWPHAVTEAVVVLLTLFTYSSVCMRQADQSCAGQAHFRNFWVAVGGDGGFFSEASGQSLCSCGVTHLTSSGYKISSLHL